MNDWQNPLASQPEPDLFPGSLIGYRQFRLPLWDTLAQGLKSLYRNDSFHSSEWHTAECAQKRDHAAPSEDCRCGFYINYLPDVQFDPVMVSKYEVRAVVECAGKIVLATKGYRAARMRILGLAAHTENVQNLSDLFPRVVPLEEWDSLVEEFPKSDYDSLLGMSVKDLASAPVTRVDLDSQMQQVVFNFSVQFGDMAETLKEITKKMEDFTSVTGRLHAPFLFPAQQKEFILPRQMDKFKKEEPRYANFKDLAKSYMALDVAQTEQLIINKSRTLRLQDFLKDEFPHTDT